jgi:tripartite-type tricarboxylate transporter receptor subunit TctC
VVVENRAGAGGSVGAVAVARAPADGHVLLVHSSGYALNPAINANLPYDYRSDFIDVAPLASQPMLLVVAPASGIGSVAELIALAKARPGQVSYGSAGIGSGAHFNSEKFRLAAGIEALHVPYKGGERRSTTLLPAGSLSRSTPSRSRCRTSASAGSCHSA